ncbi:MAG TPA: DeoR/GlpR family DNA-binding transcription regulator [Fimbriimonadaceae bacterium]|nr:DeoR/GlpR family DNA-binding transcription regulator [Fimbriimonadaceae bacterium]
MRETLELASDRQQDILLRVRVDKSVRIKDLAAEYGVHEMTIRRDLDQLADRGQIIRVHGGARINEKRAEELSYFYRSTQNIEAKERIARAAFDLIEEGDAVALDASTTCLALARLLPAKRVNAFVTSLDVADVLASEEAPFVLIGGEFNSTARSFVGALFQEALANLHPDKVFFSAKGYTPEDGFTDAHLSLAEVKIGLKKTGASMIALIDHTKFGSRSLATVARVDEVDVVVTDTEPDPAIRESFERADVRVVVAS